MLHFALVPLFGSLATASLLPRHGIPSCKKDHVEGESCESIYVSPICAPDALLPSVNPDAPCNIQTIIAYECIYGQKLDLSDGIRPPSDGTKGLSNSTARQCICESQYFTAMQGCVDCFKAHGAQEFYIPSETLNELSSAYCAATATPTLDIWDFQIDYFAKPKFNSIFTSNAATYSDPIGNKTNVSLYWTAPVATTTAMLDIGEFTGTAKPTTTAVKNGQIVATASFAAKNSAKTTGTTTTSGIAVRQTEAAFAGVLGLVGVVAML